MEAFAQGSGAFMHGHTYMGHPLACAAGVAAIRAYSDERLIERSKRLGAELFDELRRMQDRVDVIGDVRGGHGLFAVIELVRDRASRAEYPFELRAGHRACLEARPLGAVLRPLGNVVVLMPPLAMSEDELTRLGGIAVESIRRATARL